MGQSHRRYQLLRDQALRRVHRRPPRQTTHESDSRLPTQMPVRRRENLSRPDRSRSSTTRCNPRSGDPGIDRRLQNRHTAYHAQAPARSPAPGLSMSKARSQPASSVRLQQWSLRPQVANSSALVRTPMANHLEHLLPERPAGSEPDLSQSCMRSSGSRLQQRARCFRSTTGARPGADPEGYELQSAWLPLACSCRSYWLYKRALRRTARLDYAVS